MFQLHRKSTTSYGNIGFSPHFFDLLFASQTAIAMALATTMTTMVTTMPTTMPTPPTAMTMAW